MEVEKFKKLFKEKEAILAKLKEEESKNFKSFLKELFLEYPEVKRLIWEGYTPSFNDGDPCTHSEELYINWTERELDDSYDYEDEDEERGRLQFYWNEILNFEGEAPPEEVAIDSDLRQILYNFNYVEDNYNTDYIVQFYMKDGEVVEKYEYYDCGY